MLVRPLCLLSSGIPEKTKCCLYSVMFDWTQAQLDDKRVDKCRTDRFRFVNVLMFSIHAQQCPSQFLVWVVKVNSLNTISTH